jgi:hypothetical protein
MTYRCCIDHMDGGMPAIGFGLVLLAVSGVPIVIEGLLILPPSALLLFSGFGIVLMQLGLTKGRRESC